MDEMPLQLVTGADITHAKSLRQFLESARKYEPDSAVTIYDLGLGDAEANRIHSAFPQYEMRRFPFEAYPSHVDIRRNAGQYAWKPIIVTEMLRRSSGLVCWMDAGDVIKTHLRRLRRTVQRRGFFARISGRAAKWTHPLMLHHFGVSAAQARFIRNVDAACVAFDSRNARGMALAEAWREGALTEDVIAPPGSDRSNHRQDQALLGMLAYKAGFTHWPLKTVRRLEFVTHQDID